MQHLLRGHLCVVDQSLATARVDERRVDDVIHDAERLVLSRYVPRRPRALELAAYVSSAPGPRGEPLYEWIDVREVMSEAQSRE